jgi:hypothetical protein
MLKSWLKGIMYGNEQHSWGVVVPEKEMAIVTDGAMKHQS